MAFRNDQLLRYARQIVLDEIGGSGQETLLKARVLVIGAGGLGSPLLLYLAAAGVGRVGLVDHDQVDLSNLHRQIVHGTRDVGMSKTESARASLHDLNPEVEVVTHEGRIDGTTAPALVAGYDLIADGSDNFPTRDAVHAASLAGAVPLVSAAVQGFEGTLTTYKAHLGPPHPCLRCVFPEAPPPRLIPSCAEGGVLGPVAGALGSLQALEVIKELLGLGQGLSGRLLLFDGLRTTLGEIRLHRRADCPTCGPDR